MFKELFDEKKAAEVAAFFLVKNRTSLGVLKLMKLMYLAERRSFERYGEGIIGDRLVSMDKGPVLSLTYSHMCGDRTSIEGGWDSLIADRADHKIDLRDRNVVQTTAQLLQLSDADCAVLESVWAEFGQMHGNELAEYTHRNCPEWQDPDGSMIPMKPEDLFEALKFSKEQSDACLARLKQQAAISSILSVQRQ